VRQYFGLFSILHYFVVCCVHTTFSKNEHTLYLKILHKIIIIIVRTLVSYLFLFSLSTTIGSLFFLCPSFNLQYLWRGQGKDKNKEEKTRKVRVVLRAASANLNIRIKIIKMIQKKSQQVRTERNGNEEKEGGSGERRRRNKHWVILQKIDVYFHQRHTSFCSSQQHKGVPTLSSSPLPFQLAPSLSFLPAAAIPIYLMIYLCSGLGETDRAEFDLEGLFWSADVSEADVDEGEALRLVGGVGDLGCGPRARPVLATIFNHPILKLPVASRLEFHIACSHDLHGFT